MSSAAHAAMMIAMTDHIGTAHLAGLNIVGCEALFGRRALRASVVLAQLLEGLSVATASPIKQMCNRSVSKQVDANLQVCRHQQQANP